MGMGGVYLDSVRGGGLTVTRTVEAESTTSEVTGGTTLIIYPSTSSSILSTEFTVVPGVSVLTLVINCPATLPTPNTAPSTINFILNQ
jgi:hypothetical protein